MKLIRQKPCILILLAVSAVIISGCIGPTPPGSDRDEHGCIGSAGYRWCEAKQKCIRAWEENCTAQIDKVIIGGQVDEHGCKNSLGYVWCEAKQKCIFILEENCTASVQETTTTVIPTTTLPLLGGDRDGNGCIGSAGYIWCQSKEKCLRLWEESCPDRSNRTRVCTMEAKICPDGSGVGRDPDRNCEFMDCPTSDASDEQQCATEDRNVGGCGSDIQPVCGWFNETIKCFAYPCAQNFNNSCLACTDPKVKSYTQGECPKGNLIGGDKDEHGCIGSAGYSWCQAKQKCIRPWEENCTVETTTTLESVHDYASCAAAGGRLMETSPLKCRSADGRIFNKQ